MALHACGELHVRAVQLATAEGRSSRAQRPFAAAVDLVPCCYDRTPRQVYQSLSGQSNLQLDRVALKLAVTDLRKSGRVQRREIGRKLVYKSLRKKYLGVRFEAPLASTPRSWSSLDGEAWFSRVAQRDGFSLPDNLDFQLLEVEGQHLAARFERLNLPRLAFRRALEAWLVLDLASTLAGAGFTVKVRRFCPEAVTPRNLMVSARR